MSAGHPGTEDCRGLFASDGRLLAVWSDVEDDPGPEELYYEYNTPRGAQCLVAPINAVPLAVSRRVPLRLVTYGEQVEWARAVAPYVEWESGFGVTSH